ncbi:hypothetical protein BH09BAC6_BH09BAC6_04240 [soil metagenome]|jgi:hypothetical protein
MKARTNQKKSLNDILIPGSKTIDLTNLKELFTGTNIDAKKLREEAWKRKHN